MTGRSSSELHGSTGNMQRSAQFLRVSEPSQRPVRAVSSLRATGVSASEVPTAGSAGPDACRRIAWADLSLGPGTVQLSPHLHPLSADTS
jgi:hypothetical protein